jgi:hydroxypyruvate isomerase
MAKLRQSFCLPMFFKEGMKLDALLKKAKAVGYAAVEIWHRDNAPFAELLELAAKHGLRIASMCGAKSLSDGLNNPANHNSIADELHASIEIAKQHNIPGVIAFSGNRHGRDDESSIAVCAEGLRKVARAAESAGVNVNMELLNSKRDHHDYQCDHTAWGVKVCEAVNSPRVKLLYDIYHMAIMEGDLIATITENIKHIGHFHTAGNPGRGPLDDTQEICYPAVCRAIASTGYDLFIGHEFKPEADPVSALRAAFKTCNLE